VCKLFQDIGGSVSIVSPEDLVEEHRVVSRSSSPFLLSALYHHESIKSRACLP
jgi:hypothetical protein